MAQQRTILVVDDDTGVLLALQKRLTAEGYRVVTATNGADALDRARTASVDAVSLDVRLAGEIDGLQVAAALRDDPHTVAMPIIFITGSADDEFRRACEAVGGRFFLAKPYDPELVTQVLRGIFGADELGEIRELSHAKRRQPVH